MVEGHAQADLVVTGAVVRTLDADNPSAQAFAVAGGVVLAVGDDHAVRALTGPGTQTVDLGGAVVLPGLVDVHNHHAIAGEVDLHQLKVSSTASVEDVIAAVARRAADLPDGDWVVGESWGVAMIDQLSDRTVLAALDEAAAGHPVVLTDDSHHNRWANTAAMRAGGVLDLTGDPPGGHVVRDATGAPTGVLVESAGAMVSRAHRSTTHRNTEYHARNSERGIELLHRFGIVAFQEAAASLDTMAGLHALDTEGRLAAWVVSSMLVNDLIFGTEVVGEPLISAGEQFRSAHHRPDFIKIFLDGIPPSRTSAFLQPYLPDEAHGACFHGATTMDADALEAWIRRAVELGLGVKVHGIGDASVRMVLDTAERVRADLGALPPMHVAHGQYVHPDDVPRFGQLGVHADISPPLWFPTPLLQALRAVLPRPAADRVHPNRDLLDSGAVLAAGSDWPVTGTPDPWLGIAGLVTRSDPTGRFPGELWPEQAITVSEAIAAYTTGAATAMGLADVTGRLTPGMSADFVVLDRDPFAVPAQELGSVTTRETWFAGTKVFEA
ncbi:amidohydrolase family protein [Kineococcus sp. R8]|uniref:amidohydrolase n=1 Tax=Kineococcus siccus TaxID=2696567 RepID=UPI0014135965|nr:amidohydrolase [Kineococcus siccus]NAZ80419.1 amidohydrolase family protein [Kineococcus siccus]